MRLYSNSLVRLIIKYLIQQMIILLSDKIPKKSVNRKSLLVIKKFLIIISYHIFIRFKAFYYEKQLLKYKLILCKS